MASIKEHLYHALEIKFEAQKAHAMTQLVLSFENPVALGEHPQLIDDMAKLIADVAAAEENLAALRDNFGAKAVSDSMQAPVENPDASHIK